MLLVLGTLRIEFQFELAGQSSFERVGVKGSKGFDQVLNFDQAFLHVHINPKKAGDVFWHQKLELLA